MAKHTQVFSVFELPKHQVLVRVLDTRLFPKNEAHMPADKARQPCGPCVFNEGSECLDYDGETSKRYGHESCFSSDAADDRSYYFILAPEQDEGASL